MNEVCVDANVIAKLVLKGGNMSVKTLALLFILLMVMIVNITHLSAQQTTDAQVSQETTKKPFERTEAQRLYDLGMSYFMSHMYREGLDTINKVAFLYPDSDIADDALYQLALIRALNL